MNYGDRCQTVIDCYEDDDTSGSASELGTTGGDRAPNTFHDNGDVDWAWFNATAGYVYTIRTYNTGPLASPVIELYDTNGTTLLRSSSDGTIEWLCPTTGKYYVKVRNSNPAVYGCGTEYRLAINRTESCADTYEVDNTLAQAVTIGSAAQENHNFHVPGDVDWVKYAGTIGTEYTVTTYKGLLQPANTRIYVYASDGTTELASGVSSVSFTPTGTGMVYIKITEKDGAGGCDPAYEYNVQVSQ